MKKLIYLLLILPTFTTAQCWQSIDAGANHTLAIRNDGTLWSWGNNDWGKLGQTQTTISNPIPNVDFRRLGKPLSAGRHRVPE